MEEMQAEIIASHIPDWSQFATQQDLAELKSDLMRRQWIQMGAITAALTAAGGRPLRKDQAGTAFRSGGGKGVRFARSRPNVYTRVTGR